MFVPPSTPVKRNRAHNIDTDRLRARRAYLILTLANGAHVYDSRIDFAYRAAELHAIENILVDRHAIPATERRTRGPRA